ncbi:MAG TPA: hypothetical protein VF403_09575 [Kofleriaceae bacterium]
MEMRAQEDWRPVHRSSWHGYFDPISPPPEETEINSPIRDDARTGASEDLDREPDGVPHAVVGLTAFFAVIFAILVLTMFMIHSMAGKVGAALLLVLAVPVLVKKLNKKAQRDRDHVHPSL